MTLFISSLAKIIIKIIIVLQFSSLLSIFVEAQTSMPQIQLNCGDVIANNAGYEAYEYIFEGNASNPQPDADFSTCTLQFGPNFVATSINIGPVVKLFQITVINAKFVKFSSKASFNHPNSFIRIENSETLPSSIVGDDLSFATYPIYIIPSASPGVMPDFPDEFLLPNSSDTYCKFKIGSIIIKNNIFHQAEPDLPLYSASMQISLFRITKQLIVESNTFTGYGVGYSILWGFFDEDNNNDNFDSIISISHNVANRTFSKYSNIPFFEFRNNVVGFKKFVFDNNTVTENRRTSYVGRTVHFRKVLFCQGMKSLMSDPVTGLITDAQYFVGTQFNVTRNKVVVIGPAGGTNTSITYGQERQALGVSQFIGFNKNKKFLREINILHNDLRTVRTGAQLFSLISVGYVKNSITISHNKLLVDSVGSFGMYAIGMIFSAYGADPLMPFYSRLDPIISGDIYGVSQLGGSLVISNNNITVAFTVVGFGGMGLLGPISFYTVNNAESLIIEDNTLTSTSTSNSMISAGVSARPNAKAALFSLSGVVSVRRNNFTFYGGAAWLTGLGFTTVHDFLPLSSSSSSSRFFITDNFFKFEKGFELMSRATIISLNDTRVQVEISRNTFHTEGTSLTFEEADGVRFIDVTIIPGAPLIQNQLVIQDNVLNWTFSAVQTGLFMFAPYFPSNMNRILFFASQIGITTSAQYAGDTLPPLFAAGLEENFGKSVPPLDISQVPQVPLNLRLGSGNRVNVWNGAIQNFNLILLRNWNPTAGDSSIEIDNIEVNFFANSQKTAKSAASGDVTRRTLINASAGNIPSIVRITNSKFNFVENPSTINKKFDISFEFFDCSKSPSCLLQGISLFLIQGNQFTFNGLSAPTNKFILDSTFSRLGGNNVMLVRNLFNFDFSSDKNCDQIKSSDAECGLIRLSGMMKSDHQSSDLQSSSIQVSNNTIRTTTTSTSSSNPSLIQFCDSFSLLSADEYLLSLAASTKNTFSIQVSGNEVDWKTAASNNNDGNVAATVSLLSSSVDDFCQSSNNINNNCWIPPSSTSPSSSLTLSKNNLKCDSLNGYDSFSPSLSQTSKNTIASNFKCSLLSSTFSKSDFITSSSSSSATPDSSILELISNSITMVLPSDNPRNISTTSISSSIPFRVGQGWSIQISSSSSREDSCNKIIEKRIVSSSSSFTQSTLTLGVELTRQIFDASSRNNNVVSPSEYCFHAHSFEQNGTDENTNSTSNTTTTFAPTNTSTTDAGNSTTENVTTTTTTPAPPPTIAPQLEKTANGLQGFSMAATTLSSISVPTLGFGVARQQAMFRVLQGLRSGSCQGLPDPPAPMEAADSPTQMIVGDSQGRFHIGAVIGDIVLAYGLIILCQIAGTVFVSRKKSKNTNNNRKNNNKQQHFLSGSFQLEVFARAHVTTMAFVMSSLFFSTVLTQAFLVVASPNSDVPVAMKVVTIIIAIVFAFIPSVMYIYVNLFGRKKIEICRSIAKQQEIVKNYNNSKSRPKNENVTTREQPRGFVQGFLLPKFNYFFGPEGEWEVPRSTKRDEFIRFQISVPVIEGYRKNARWFAIVEFASQFGLALASLIPQFVPVSASCITQVVLVCVSLGVFFILCCVFRPFQERFVRVVIPISALFEVVIIAVAAYFGDDPPDWIDTLIAVSLSLQSAISIVGLVMTFLPLFGPLVKFLMRFLRRGGKKSSSSSSRNNDKNNNTRTNLRSLFVDDGDVEVFGQSLLLEERRFNNNKSKNKNNNNDRKNTNYTNNNNSLTSRSNNNTNTKTGKRSSTNFVPSARPSHHRQSSRNVDDGEDDRRERTSSRNTPSSSNNNNNRRSNRNNNDGMRDSRRSNGAASSSSSLNFSRGGSFKK